MATYTISNNNTTLSNQLHIYMHIYTYFCIYIRICFIIKDCFDLNEILSLDLYTRRQRLNFFSKKPQQSTIQKKYKFSVCAYVCVYIHCRIIKKKTTITKYFFSVLNKPAAIDIRLKKTEYLL